MSESFLVSGRFVRNPIKKAHMKPYMELRNRHFDLQSENRPPKPKASRNPARVNATRGLSFCGNLWPKLLRAQGLNLNPVLY